MVVGGGGLGDSKGVARWCFVLCVAASFLSLSPRSNMSRFVISDRSCAMQLNEWHYAMRERGISQRLMLACELKRCRTRDGSLRHLPVGRRRKGILQARPRYNEACHGGAALGAQHGSDDSA